MEKVSKSQQRKSFKKDKEEKKELEFSN
jgi:hypothetical protein